MVVFVLLPFKTNKKGFSKKTHPCQHQDWDYHQSLQDAQKNIKSRSSLILAAFARPIWARVVCRPHLCVGARCHQNNDMDFPPPTHRSPKSRLSRTYRRNLRETAAASYRGSTGLRQTLGQGFDSTFHTPSTGPSVGPTVGVPQAYGRP